MVLPEHSPENEDKKTATGKAKTAAMSVNNNDMSVAVERALFNSYCYPESFIDYLDDAIQESVQSEASGALMLVSVSNLSMIIGSCGHEMAEVVMQDLRTAIKKILKEDDVIERLQRDQFGIILSGCYPTDVDKIADRVCNIILNFGRDSEANSTLHVMAAVGSVNFPSETSDTHDALDKAFIAVHSTNTLPHRTYNMAQTQADSDKQQMGLANFLFKAYKEERLRLAYQPIVGHSGEISHYEALLRLINHSGKISSAGALIPVAEEMGMIGTIDTMVMEMVIEELKNDPNVHLAFNVSNHTTENDVWLDRVNALLEDRHDIASRLIIEITETAIHRDLRRTAFFVASLQSLGCQVALDDFGSGYTSFRQLKALSVDMVKIDGVFIKDLPDSADNQFFVKTLMDFAKGFGLKTVAEFVENGEITKILMDMGVDYMQGYYLGKPENHRSWLKEGEYSKE